ncbi:unnamed protein product [Coccothraustes coccothraustes]
MPRLAAVLRRAGWASLGCGGPAAGLGAPPEPALSKRKVGRVSAAASQTVCAPVPCSRRCFAADAACGRVVFEGRIGATGSGSKAVYVLIPVLPVTKPVSVQVVLALLAWLGRRVEGFSMAAGQQKLPRAISSLLEHLSEFCLIGRVPLLYALSEQRVHIDFAPGLCRAPGL